MSTELTLNEKPTSISEYTAQVDADIKRFELLQRKAQLLSNSTIVPKEYRSKIEKTENFKTVLVDNPNALSNCVIAIDMAHRMNANELMVMQNLTIIQGRPSWSSQWIIAAINNCGKYTALRFETKNLGEKTVQYNQTYWENKIKKIRTIDVKIHDMSCVAYAIEKSTGEKLESATITIELAVKEGWYTKDGSKWQTMPEIMLRYRSASMFGKVYAPELLMGIQSSEEVQDIDDDLSTKYKDAITVDKTPKAKFKPIVTESVAPEATVVTEIEGEEILPAELKTDLFDDMEETDEV